MFYVVISTAHTQYTRYINVVVIQENTIECDIDDIIILQKNKESPIPKTALQQNLIPAHQLRPPPNNRQHPQSPPHHPTPEQHHHRRILLIRHNKIKPL